MDKIDVMRAVSAKTGVESSTTETRRPTRLSAAIFLLKANVLRFDRGLANIARGPRHLVIAGQLSFPHLVGRSRTPLWSDLRPAEQVMQSGKVENLRVAARLLDRTLLQPGETFSFWRQTGKPIRRRGFVTGRMLQQGCIVPATGGGLCQLSNALYDVALKAGCTIVERHAHSRVVPGSAADQGRDATVAWNYVDLRFRSTRPLLLRVQMTADELVVSLYSAAREEVTQNVEAVHRAPEVLTETCGTCGDASCFRHEKPTALRRGRTAFLVNEAWPEFRNYVAQLKVSEDALFIPIDGKRLRLSRYSWDTSGFESIVTAPVSVLRHSLATRSLGKQGAARRIAELKAAERVAERFARKLAPDVTELYVAQSLLPFLWRDGHLGGRRFRVLITALPMHEIHRQLDEVAALHPDRATLSDFRASAELAELEQDALNAAERIVTPHAEIAKFFGPRALKLPWHVPAACNRKSMAASTRRVAFPGPTVARKGCYELRAAARVLDLEIVPLGSELEGSGFWSDVRTAPSDHTHWLDGISVVVQPAIVEQAPRRLLAALESGVPAIATAACGLDPQPGLTIIPSADTDALVAALRTQLDGTTFP
jgi:hypothetical protein